MKQALLIGPIFDQWHIDFVSHLVETEGYVHIVAVDGGAEVCRLAHVIPTLYVGDKDSISQEALDYIELMQVERIELQRQKDVSDFSSALSWLLQQGVRSVEALGFVGGRLDHQLAVLGEMLHQKIDGVFFDEKLTLWAATQSGRLPKKVVVSKAEYENFSVFALIAPACVSVDGAVWPLEKCVLKPCVSLGLSNEFAPEAFDARVLVHEGGALIIANKELGM